jgi:replicative DNA helicase
MKQPEGRVPPHSIEAEEQLLSSVFLDGAETLMKALDAKVTEESFYVPANALIWKTITWAYRKGIPLETHAIAGELKRLGKLDQIGGVSYLAKATSAMPTTAGTSHSIKKVQELYMLRTLIRKGTQIVDDAYDYTGDLSSFVQNVEEAIAVREGLEKPKTIADACDAYAEKLDRIQAGKATQDDKGLDWPWPDANKFLKPIRRGEVVVPAARPSRGKSSLARQLVQYWSQYGTVLYFTREMDVDEVAPLFAQTQSGLPLADGEIGRWHAKEYAEFKTALQDVKKMKNAVIIDTDNNEAQILARFKAYSQREKVVAVVIDYLQLMDMKIEKGGTRDQAIGQFMLAIKDAAKNSGVPFVVLAQLNRSSEKEERKPRLSDLRESGNIEQTATRVVFIHWNATTRQGVAQDFEDEATQTIECQLIQAKSRYTGAATCDLLFKRPLASFYSINHAANTG